MSIIKYFFIAVVIGFLAYKHAIREQEKVDVWNYKVKLLTSPFPGQQMRGYQYKTSDKLGETVRRTAFRSYTKFWSDKQYYSNPRTFSAIQRFIESGGAYDDKQLKPPLTFNPIRHFLSFYRPAEDPSVIVRHFTGPNSPWSTVAEAREIASRYAGQKPPMVYPDGWLEAGGRYWSKADLKELQGPYDKYDFDYPFDD